MISHVQISNKEAERLLTPVAELYGANARWLRVRTADYFGTLDFSGKRILEIGAGNGLYACCVASLHAEHLIALEPQLDGARASYIATFEQRIEKLKLPNLELQTVRLEGFSAPSALFDLIYMLTVINHLDETHVRTLDTDEHSREVFRQRLRPVYEWLKPGGTLVISDNTNTHAYMPLMKLGLLKRHPFAPSITWEIHQPPRVWKMLLESIGFTSICYHWATHWRYPQIPRVLCENVIAAYLYSGVFVLSAQRPE
jgi:SAM-dependent methyltransferase